MMSREIPLVRFIFEKFSEDLGLLSFCCIWDLKERERERETERERSREYVQKRETYGVWLKLFRFWIKVVASFLQKCF